METAVLSKELKVNNPELWSTKKPTIYTLRATITKDGTEMDSVDTTIGFRSTKFTANDGFYLNDEELYMKGKIILTYFFLI